MVAYTGLSVALVIEKLADTRPLPAVTRVTSSGSTSSCADAGCEITVPITAQRASTVPRTRPLRSAPARAGGCERDLSIGYGAERGKKMGKVSATSRVGGCREG